MRNKYFFYIVPIKSSVKKIGKSAFENCHQLRIVSIPETIESVGDNAFKDCDKLDSESQNQISNRFGFRVTDYEFYEMEQKYGLEEALRIRREQHERELERELESERYIFQTVFQPIIEKDLSGELKRERQQEEQQKELFEMQKAQAQNEARRLCQSCRWKGSCHFVITGNPPINCKQYNGIR